MILFKSISLLLLYIGIVQSADPTENLIPTYGSDLVASSNDISPVMSGLDMLRMAVPGNPGEDYPVYAEVPSTGFSCSGRVEGGYYADPEADCQPFHVCSADSSGGLAKVSFLCPNGTLFNQETFVCEYWFNVDCSQAESFYGLNDNIGTVEQKDGLASAASSPQGGYAAPGRAGRQGRVISKSRQTKPKPTSRSLTKVVGGFSIPPKRSNSQTRQTDLSSSGDTTQFDRSRISGSKGTKNVASRKQNSSPQKERLTKRKESSIPTKILKPPKLKPVENPQSKPIRTGQLNEKSAGRKRPFKSQRQGRQEVSRGYLPPKDGPVPPADSYAAGSSANFDYQDAPLAATGNVDSVDDLTDAVYQEDELPTYNNGVFTNGNAVAGSSYSAPIADAISPSDSDFDEDILPAYNNGVYNNAGTDVSEADGTSYVAPSDDSYRSSEVSTKASDASIYEEDELPTYNSGVYFDGKTVGGSSYTAPVADSLSPNDSDFDEDILPAYNNGVYNNANAGAEEGTSYVAPAPANFVPNSYLPPSNTADSESSDGTSYAAPPDFVPNSYLPPTGRTETPDNYLAPQTDILPEYFKSEIGLGLTDPQDVPRVEPFLSDYGTSGSSPVGVVVDAPPVISLEDYNLQEVSDKGFSGLESGSYGR